MTTRPSESIQKNDLPRHQRERLKVAYNEGRENMKAMQSKAREVKPEAAEQVIQELRTIRDATIQKILLVISGLTTTKEATLSALKSTEGPNKEVAIQKESASIAKRGVDPNTATEAAKRIVHVYAELSKLKAVLDTEDIWKDPSETSGEIDLGTEQPVTIESEPSIIFTKDDTGETST